MSMRSHFCGQLTRENVGQTVTLGGWINRRRDHGGVIFLDVRDKEGLVQVVCNPDDAAMFELASSLRNEFCVKITGHVVARDAALVNAKLPTGEIEVVCDALEILNPSVTPPFQLDEENLSETTRLTHRVLDLRRPQMQHNMKLRYRTAMAIRKFLDANDFIDIETPMLELISRLDERRQTARCKTYDRSTAQIVRRLKEHETKTVPVIEKYEQQHGVIKIDGLGSIDEVYGRICAAIDHCAKHMR